MISSAVQLAVYFIAVVTALVGLLLTARA